MGGVTRNHEHKRFDGFQPSLRGIGQQMNLGFLMHPHAIFELDDFDLFSTVVSGVKVLLGDSRRLLHKTVFNGTRQRVVHHHVFEGHGLAARAFSKRRGSDFQT